MKKIEKPDLLAAIVLVKKKETKLLPKALLFLALCYALSPIDLIPDFIPVLGLLDDAFLIPLLLVLAYKLLPREALEKAKREALSMESLPVSKKLWYAIPVLAVWIFGVILLWVFVDRNF